jgi:hypothetical protein
MLILENIKIEFDPARLAADMHLDINMAEFLEFKELIEQVESIAAPRVLLSELAVIGADDSRLISSAGEFNCSLLAQLAGECKFIFPFIATCGKEMENLGSDISDPLQLYWLDFLKEYALETAFQKAKAETSKKCHGQIITSLIPIDDELWPLSGLREIFGVFAASDIEYLGVKLTEYLCMKPTKSRAGVFFSSHEKVDLCSLCSVKKCKTCPLGEKGKEPDATA